MSEFVVVHRFDKASRRDRLEELLEGTRGARAIDITSDGALTIFQARRAEAIARMLRFWRIPYERILPAEAVATGQSLLHSKPQRRGWFF